MLSTPSGATPPTAPSAAPWPADELSALTALAAEDPRPDRRFLALQRAATATWERAMDPTTPAPEQTLLLARAGELASQAADEIASGPTAASMHLLAARIDDQLDRAGPMQTHLEAVRRLAGPGDVLDEAETTLVDRYYLRASPTPDDLAAGRDLLEHVAQAGASPLGRAVALNGLASLAFRTLDYDGCTAAGTRLFESLRRDPALLGRESDKRLEAARRQLACRAHQLVRAEAIPASRGAAVEIRRMSAFDLDPFEAADVIDGEYERLSAGEHSLALWDRLATAATGTALEVKYRARELLRRDALDQPDLVMRLRALPWQLKFGDRRALVWNALLSTLREVWRTRSERGLTVRADREVAEAAIATMAALAPNATLTLRTRLDHARELARLGRPEGRPACQALATEAAAPPEIQLEAAACALSDASTRCESLATLERAVELARRLSREGDLATALGALADCYAFKGRLSDASARLEQLLALRSLPAALREEVTLRRRRFGLAETVEKLRADPDATAPERLAQVAAEAARDPRLCDIAFVAGLHSGLRWQQAGRPESSVHVLKQAREVGRGCAELAAMYDERGLETQRFELTRALARGLLSVGELETAAALLSTYAGAASRRQPADARLEVAHLLATAGAGSETLEILADLPTVQAAERSAVIAAAAPSLEASDVEQAASALLRSREPPLAALAALAARADSLGARSTARRLHAPVLARNPARLAPVEAAARAEAELAENVRPELDGLDADVPTERNPTEASAVRSLSRFLAKLKKSSAVLREATRAAQQANVLGAVLDGHRAARRRMAAAIDRMAATLRTVQPDVSYTPEQREMFRAEFESRLQEFEAEAERLALEASDMERVLAGLEPRDGAGDRVPCDQWPGPGGAAWP